VRRVVPPPVRRRLRAVERRWLFVRLDVRAFRRRRVLLLALDELRRLDGPPSQDLLERLEYGWANEEYGASPELLGAVIADARRADGPILECGCGLSTLVLGVEAAKRGVTVYSLEQNRHWARRTQRSLRRHRIESVSVAFCPLRCYDGFVWYAPTGLPSSIALVVCDGPSVELGGRYGLLPMIRERLAPHAVILLDDVARDDVRQTLVRWVHEFGTVWTLEGAKKPYARIGLV
jgi:predicted O-methyltransferase YrrM